VRWPSSIEVLVEEQELLAAAKPPQWHPRREPYPIGGCFICFPRGQSGPGMEGDPAWAGAAVVASGHRITSAEAAGFAGAPYEAGLLALREGPLLEAAVRSLPRLPEVLLVNATGRDHPRSAGLALHLGAILDLPTIGVTHRPLLAEGKWPQLARGAHTPLVLAGRCVGYWLCTRRGKRPVAVHAAWRTDPEIAVAVLLSTGADKARTPEPIRQARQIARVARATAGTQSLTSRDEAD
jgi:deoxyribonuclease V